MNIMKPSEVAEHINLALDQVEQTRKVLMEVLFSIETAECADDIEEAIQYIHGKQDRLPENQYIWLISLLERRALPYFIEKENEEDE